MIHHGFRSYFVELFYIDQLKNMHLQQIQILVSGWTLNNEAKEGNKMTFGGKRFHTFVAIFFTLLSWDRINA